MAMDPPESPSVSFGNGHGYGGRDAEGITENPRRCADPPEQIFELVPPPPHPSPSALRTGNSATPPSASGSGDGREPLDRSGLGDELERLVAVGSRVGAGGSRAGNASQRQQLAELCIPIAAACSLAWNPRNRARSASVLLFAAFLCLVKLMKNDAGASRRSFGRINKKNSNDPFAALNADQRLSVLKQVFGSWTFYDGGAEDRPTTPYVTVANAGNPYLDLPEDNFPLESWQADAVYANHFLDAAEKLVRRGQQAIFTTYHGYGISGVRVDPDGAVDYEMEDADRRVSQRKTMFHLEEIDLASVTTAEELLEVAPHWHETGGWTTERSFEGLQRRITHAMMTESKFTVVITGNWQSMGYGGNHGFQSMASVFEKLLKELFKKLGVELVVRAIGLPPLDGLSTEEHAQLRSGGKSTLLHALGWSSIYGSAVDMVIWDDYSTIDPDGEVSAHKLDGLSKGLFDLFARQAILSGDTNLPFFWGGDFEVLRYLHEHGDVDVGQLGNGMTGVAESTSAKVAHDLPWAAQYLNCPKIMKKACIKYQFASKCWIERPDVKPTTPQLDNIRVLPTAIGWRTQQLKAYTLAYNFLQATLDAINQWSTITISQGFPLPDEYWHVGDYMQNIQEKVKALDEASAPHCFALEERINLPKRLCLNKLKGRTEHTPRANPKETSVRSLLDEDVVPKSSLECLYQGNDVENPMKRIPAGEVDAQEIMDLQGKRRRWRRLANSGNSTSATRNAIGGRQHSRMTYEISMGDGWQLLHSYGDECDGTLLSTPSCGRHPSSNCLLEGHQGSRGGIWGNETTGWLILHLKGVESGFIALNLEVGSRGDKSPSERLQSLPNSFVFEYAVSGTISTLERDAFVKKLLRPAPGVGILIVLDNADNKEAKDVVVAVRAIGCPEEAECQFGVTHVYWT